MFWSVHVVLVIHACCGPGRMFAGAATEGIGGDGICVRAVVLVGCGSGEYPGVAQVGPGGSSGVPANVVVGTNVGT